METRFTPEIDCKIIRGYVRDREAMFRRLQDEYGLHEEEIAARAAELGIDWRLIEQLQIAGVSYAARTCLGCEQDFVSKGPQNRFCPSCSRKRAGKG